LPQGARIQHAMNFWGKKKADPPPVAAPPAAPPPGGQGDGIARCRETIETTGKREQHIQRKIDDEVKNAKKAMERKDKRAALQCIKKKKLYEAQLDQLQAAKMNLEKQLIALEGMTTNQQILAANKAAAAEMEAGVQAMGGVDGIDTTMDRMDDALTDAAEIGDALAREVGGGAADEDDLLAELEALEQDGIVEGLTKVALEPASAGVSMPSAPVSFPEAGTGAVAQKGMTDEEKELAALEQSMNM